MTEISAFPRRQVFVPKHLALFCASLILLLANSTTVAQDARLNKSLSARTSQSVPSKPMTNAIELWQDRPLSSLKADISTNGDLPPNFAAQRISEAGVLFDSIDDSRPWIITKDFEWDAPASRHLPLLFEEPNLERLGYTQRCDIDRLGYDGHPVAAEYVQPVVSGVKFFGNVAMLPYNLGVHPPYEPVYTLGVDRPGSPVCYRKYKIPLSVKGALFQAGVVSTLVFAIP